ncbi:MAG: hypothetical protein K2W95_22890 [Candidatus Obscuribacterales bacterium]|nr:hypothetical protein [Candidatus Obscuribacterales bacterium]
MAARSVRRPAFRAVEEIWEEFACDAGWTFESVKSDLRITMAAPCGDRSIFVSALARPRPGARNADYADHADWVTLAALPYVSGSDFGFSFGSGAVKSAAEALLLGHRYATTQYGLKLVTTNLTVAESVLRAYEIERIVRNIPEGRLWTERKGLLQTYDFKGASSKERLLAFSAPLVVTDAMLLYSISASLRVLFLGMLEHGAAAETSPTFRPGFRKL